MTGRYDFFNVGAAPSEETPYQRLGYPRNPFRSVVHVEESVTAPFYTGHIKEQLGDLQRWIQEVHEQRVMQPLSLVGTPGTGKTTILRALEAGLSAWPPTEKVAVHSVLLSDSGFARASVGAILVSGLERAMESIQVDGVPPPEDVLPLVWAMIHAPSFPEPAPGPLAAAFRKARSATGDRRRILAESISQWLRRLPLTTTRARESGLVRAIDWEGELVGVIAEVLRLARLAGVLSTFFLFVDQIEELFRPTFSELRRARILTDLRSLVDDIEEGAPVGLLLAWTPESDSTFTKKYEALVGRLRRRRIDLPLLSFEDAEPFAKVWVEALPAEPSSAKKRPKIRTLVEGAWARLHRQRELFQTNKATPRMLLTALANEVDELAGVSSAGAGSAS